MNRTPPPAGVRAPPGTPRQACHPWQGPWTFPGGMKGPISSAMACKGSLSARKTWRLLRHLIDPLTSKSETNRNKTRTLNNSGGEAVKLVEDLRDKYLKTKKIGEWPGPYRGLSNESVDQPFIDSELRFG